MATAPDTRTRLIDSAMHRFASEGVLAATLDEVRADAEASVGAVYHHFPDKGALVDAVRERALVDFQDAFAAELERHRDAEDGIKAMVRFLVRWCFGNRDEATLLLEGRPRRAVELNREFFDRVQGWWTIHAHYGTVRDLDFAVVHSIWLGPALELTRHGLGGTARRPDRAAIEALADAAWAALRADR
ncbi:MAG: TetR/AcrR family transcriptional regulator [Solirubrobacterales bacterium]|nr:TetR/AcrR family transcriptional regulator [Solirubrobacterales bacterium]